MAIPSIQTSFAAGELSPSLYGHVDFAKFSIGASTMRNMFVSYRGGGYSRAGTAFIGYSKQVQSTFASGHITWVSNPSNGETITLNGVTWTFVSGSAGSNQTHIQGTLAFTLANLVMDLAASVNPALVVASYSQVSGTKISIVYSVVGVAGDSYTLAASVASVSGPTLTGGSTSPPRLITFQFNLNQGLVLEFGELYMRVISNGGFVLESSKSIIGITKANPAVVNVTAHGWSSGDWIFIAGATGMTQVDNMTYVITVIDADHFSLQDVFGANINSTAYGTYTGSGTAARIYTLATPYHAADLDFLKFTQSADVMSLTLRNQNSGVEYAPQELSRIADDNWTIAPLSVASSISPPMTLDGTATVTGMTNYQYVVTAISAATGQESVASPIIDIPSSADISSTAGSEVLNWDAVAGARYYNVYKAPAAYMSTVPVGSLFGFAGSTFGSAFVDSNITADVTQSPPLHENPFAPGAAIGVTVTATGSSLGGLGFTINTSTGSGATGYGVVVSGAMQAFIFTSGGEDYAQADTITFFDSTGVAASGTLTWTTNPSNGETVTLNGVVWTFVSGTASGNQTHITGTLAFTLANFADDVGNSTNPLLTVAGYVETSGTVVTVTYKTSGSAGNAYTLAASVAIASAGTLTGGTGGVSPTGTLIVGPETGTYPSTVAYFQERRAYANSANQPDTYWMSQPGAFTNFDSRVPTIDSDAIIGTPWSVAVDGIQFMVPVLGGLVTLTGQTAFLLFGSGGSPTSPQPITPTSQQALPQTYNGCHYHVAPVKIDNDIYYLQAKGSVIRSLVFNYWINVLTGTDVTYLSSQLFTGYSVASMTWCEEPFKLMWACRGDGVLLSLTSLKAQDVMGWTRHDTQGLYLNCTSVIEPPSDALYLVTQRFLPNGHTPFMIERMDNRLWNTVEDCWCVDAGAALAQGHPAANITISSNSGLGAPVNCANLVGGGGYSAGTAIVVQDPTGTGCVVTQTISGGVITALFFAGGTNYTNPTLQAVDANGPGTGFSATVILNNSATIVASGAVFNSGMVGWVIRAGGGVATISAYIGPTSVTVQVTAPFVQVLPNPAGVPAGFGQGTWSLTEPTAAINGLSHLAGMTVTGLADGNVIPPQVVSATGTITLDAPASAVIVGLPFTPQLQSLYLEGGQPTVQGRRKKIGAVTVRVESSGDFQVGANQPDGAAQSPIQIEPRWSNLTAASVSVPGLSQVPYGSAEIENTVIVRATPLYTGDVRALITSGFEKPGQIAVQQTQPLPLQVLAFVREAEDGDSPETVPRPPPRGGQ